VRRVAGGYLACCPAHDDRHPSLSVGTGAEGRLLLHCFTGCPFAAVLTALGAREEIR
jgi:DNA primase